MLQLLRLRNSLQYIKQSRKVEFARYYVNPLYEMPTSKQKDDIHTNFDQTVHLSVRKHKKIIPVHLIHYQTTNFRLFQTEKVCRRQFQI